MSVQPPITLLGEMLLLLEEEEHPMLLNKIIGHHADSLHKANVGMAIIVNFRMWYKDSREATPTLLHNLALAYLAQTLLLTNGTTHQMIIREEITSSRVNSLLKESADLERIVNFPMT